jgi:hypothetical protein
MDLNCSRHTLINKISVTILIILLIILFCYLLLYSIYYILTPCDVEKKFNLNISNICPVVKYPEPSQSFIQREIELEKEVFHVDNQTLTYDQAREKCRAYNSVLATKEQITEAYNKGANWCSYGWTEGQNAFYPVQKCMQKQKCGVAGINGGYFAEPNIKFGANCYGIKPADTNIEPKSIYCTEKQFCEKDTNKEACSKQKNDFISPFNNDKWSMY